MRSSLYDPPSHRERYTCSLEGMIITAVVIDGFHAGHTMAIEYYPTLKLLKPKVVRIDYCCPGYDDFIEPVDTIEYKECFRAIDKKMVLYSEKGESLEMIGRFPMAVTRNPWTERTTLYMGYHNEPVRRTDEEVVSPSLPT